MPAKPVVPEDLRTKLLRVRGLILDVDGVLTDGSLMYTDDGREIKSFDAKDGMGLVLLRELGYRIGIISSRISKVVEARCRELRLPPENLLQGELDKLAAMERLLNLWDLKHFEVVAVGDDLPDLGILRRAGVGACPSDAVQIVKDAAILHLTRPGGHGAVRELCDLILEIRKGARADPLKPVPTEPEPEEGDVIPFPSR
ncbi:MAG: HAD hydrolase family protein [Acidobacteria bacterium]|nr:HAD hydrolase family protein [Acidobacteriota bacterium]MCK6681659.1 HAD hydrolase family protein [Thermoanaerobaculia bacterium]